VKTGVLYHLIGGQRAPIRLDSSASIFVDGVHSQFSGEVIVGHDLMVL
jgi:hypothetical protein